MKKAILLLIALACIAAVVIPLPAQAPKQAAPAQPEPKPRLMSPSEAASIAAEDIQNVPQLDQPFVLYAFFELPLPIKHAAFSTAVNYSMNSLSVLHAPQVIGDGYVVRLYLHHLAEGRQLANILNVLENKLAFNDPDFHKRGLVKSGGQYLLKVFNEPDGTPIRPYRANDGRTYDFRTVAINREDQFALHLEEHGMQNILLLHGLTGRDLPIVRADWFQNLILSTINVGRTKGVYYDLLGINGLKKREVYALFGHNQDTIDNLGSESRAAFMSKVTNSIRVVAASFTQGVRPTAGIGLLLETRDIAFDDIDEGADAILNLKKFKVSAFEVFIIDKNGRIVFLLFDGNDNLQESVPDKIAHDFTVDPEAAQPLLVPGIGCICCHGTWKHQVAGVAEPVPAKMFIEFENEVLLMYASTFQRSRKGIIAAQGSKLKDLIETYGQYNGDLKPILRLAAAFHSNTIFELTGQQMDAIAASIEEDRDRYCYAHLDNRAVLRRLGYDIDPVGKDENERTRYMAKRFNEIVPQPPSDAFGFSDEDGRVLRLRNELASLKLTPAQWEAIAADVYLTAWQAKKAKAQAEPAKQSRVDNETTYSTAG